MIKQVEFKGRDLNAEQKRELREYAESKGIVLTGYAKTDVDVSLMKKVMDGADSILQTYPELRGTKEKPFTLKVVNGMDANDFAMTARGNDSHIIQLNANAFRDEQKLAEEYQKLVEDGWFVKGTTYRSIVMHEMGHMFQNTHRIENKEILNIACLATGIPSVKEMFSHLEKHFSACAGSYKSGIEIISEVFSDYFSSTTPSEFSKVFMDILLKEVAAHYDSK